MGKVWKMPVLPVTPKPVIIAPTVDNESRSANAEVLFRSTGAKSLAQTLLLLPQTYLDAAGYEMAVIGREVIIDAQANYVPYDVGDLSASGDSDEYTPGSIDAAQIAMWFGGEIGPEAVAHGVVDVRRYALEQHENMEYHHPAMKKDSKGNVTGGGPVGGGPPGSGTGGPKYLERPLQKIEHTVVPRLAAAIAKVGDMNTAFVLMGLTE